MADLQREILNEYFIAMKESILRCILQDPYEKLRLNIKFFPLRWPSLLVRAPMPWHTSVTVAKQKLYYIYFQGNCILLELKKIWNEKYALILNSNIKYFTINYFICKYYNFFYVVQIDIVRC